MRTEITKSFSWGFIATEQDYRRLIQTATDHLLKPSGAQLSSTKYEVNLKDGSVFETTALDDIFQLENAGNKLIRSIACKLYSTHAGGECKIDVELKDGLTNEKNWDSATYKVSGDTRDWAFVAASELDERLKRMKIVAWEAMFASKWISLLIMIIVMLASLIGASYFKAPDTTHVQLQTMYKAGKFSNPIEAIVELEKIKASRSTFDDVLPMILMWAFLFVLVFGGAWLLPRLSPSYNFCWGEYTAQYGKRIRTRNALFTLVILALVISVLANFISKKIGI